MSSKSQTAWFTSDILEFLSDLGQNNNPKWFAANKPRYESSVWEPMKALAAELIPRMAEIDPEVSRDPIEALFRLNRDTRNSYDKSPYKTHAGILISRRGETRAAHPGLYVQISAQSFGIASGFHALSPNECMTVRRHIAAHPTEFLAELNNKSFRQHFLSLRGEPGKILPPELSEAAQRQPLIFNKQFYYWAEHLPDRILSGDLPEFIMDHMKACRGMNDFLGRAFLK